MIRSFAFTLLLVAATSQADERAQINKWAFFKGATPNGTPICGLAATPTKGESVKNVSIKAFGGQNNLSITMFKDSWSIPRGKSISTSIDFMDGQPLVISAYGDGKIVDVQMPSDSTVTLLGRLSSSSTMRLSFPNGSEPEWRISLAGVKPLLKKFVECALQQEHTQPF